MFKRIYTVQDALHEKFNAIGYKDAEAVRAADAAKIESDKVLDLLQYFWEIGILMQDGARMYYIYPVNGKYVENRDVYEIVSHMLAEPVAA